MNMKQDLNKLSNSINVLIISFFIFVFSSFSILIYVKGTNTKFDKVEINSEEKGENLKYKNEENVEEASKLIDGTDVVENARSNDIKDEDKVIADEPVSSDHEGVRLTDLELNNLKIECNNSYKKALEMKEKDKKIEEFMRIDEICDKILRVSDDPYSLELKMIINNKISLNNTIKSKKYEYSRYARECAYKLLSTSEAEDDIDKFQYYYAQFTYQMGGNTNEEESKFLYKESISYFDTLTDREPYWSRHYIIGAYRALYNITKDEAYLKKIQETISIELIDNGFYEFTDEQILELLTQLADVQYIFGENRSEENRKDSIKFYAKSEELVNKAFEYGYTDYLNSQSLKLEEMVSNGQ